MLRPHSAFTQQVQIGASVPTGTPKTFAMMGSSSASRHGSLNGVAPLATFASSQDNGDFNWFNALRGNAYKSVGNYGVAGTFSADCLNSQLPQVLALRPLPSVVAVITGSNDVQNAVDVLVTIANLTKIYDELRRVGIIVFCYALHHLRQGGATQTQGIQQINQAVRAYCDANTGAIYVDTTTDTTDFTDNTNGYAKANFVTTDNIHRTPKASRQIAERLNADPAVTALLQGDRQLVESAIDTRTFDSRNRNIVDDPFFRGTVGAGNTSTNCAIAATGGSPTFTPTLAARSDGLGNNQQVAITSTAANDTIQISGVLVNNAFVAAGDQLQGTAFLSMTGATQVKSLNFQIVFTVGGTVYRTVAMAAQALNASEYDQRDIADLMYQTPIFTVPAGTATTGRWRVEVVFDAASTGTVITVSRAQIRKVN